MRTHVYQPLYEDVRGIEESIQAVSIEKPPLTPKLTDLQRSGALERIPRPLQSRLMKISEEAQRIGTAVGAVHEIVLREMSSRIMQLRTEEADRIWRARVSQILREMSSSEKGISDSISFSLNHAGRSPAVDLRNPGKPIIVGPGGPSFVITDWLAYPESIQTIEKLWTKVAYLYFNEVRDASYYQLTRDDLGRLDITLSEYLKPVHQMLRENADFQILLNTRPALLSEIAQVKGILADRIRDPKHLGDLISR